MCITNDDATRNGNKRNNLMKKMKMLEEGEGKHEKKEMVVTIEEKKETKYDEKNLEQQQK